jgi:hypothetical protein
MSAARTPYQLTPAASKGNAFCWLSWEPQINWRGTNGVEQAQGKRNQAMEEKRAAGKDPLYVPGLRTNHNMLRDPTAFAMLSPWKKGKHGHP